MCDKNKQDLTNKSEVDQEELLQGSKHPIRLYFCRDSDFKAPWPSAFRASASTRRTAPRAISRCVMCPNAGSS